MGDRGGRRGVVQGRGDGVPVGVRALSARRALGGDRDSFGEGLLAELAGREVRAQP
ncbi:hypothetical protein ACFV24_22465 [Nocardia fluminea]|uniref:hypothetical protein n=1 Tax=Nocardia fluminea TaxID=134984 RepID=UPI00366BD413